MADRIEKSFITFCKDVQAQYSTTSVFYHRCICLVLTRLFVNLFTFGRLNVFEIGSEQKKNPVLMRANQ